LKDKNKGERSSGSAGRGAVLLVDDEPAILEFGKEMLEYFGFEPLCAENGEDALACFGERKDDLDLVILDLNMPGMGGAECFERMVRIKPDVKILVTSGFAPVGEVRELLDRGSAGFLMKPFRVEVLVEKIEEILGLSLSPVR